MKGYYMELERLFNQHLDMTPITPTAQALYQRIIWRLNKKYWQEPVSMSYQDMAVECHCERKTAMRAIAELEAARLVHVVRSSGRRPNSIYLTAMRNLKREADREERGTCRT